MTSSFFGGIATLVAAYIATHLFNDWRVVQSGSNRSDHAKITLKSLFEMQVMLDFYYKEVCTIAKHPKSIDIHHCYNLRKKFNDNYLKLITEFSVNSSLYEAVYGDILSNLKTHDINDFNSYLFSINGALSRAINTNPHNNDVTLEFYIKHAEKSKERFKENVVDEVTKKLSPHIKLKTMSHLTSII